MLAAGLCSAFGWRAARLFYGVFILAYAALFAATARSLPPPAPGATTATPRDRLMTPRVARQSSQGRKLKLVASRKPFTMRLLTTRPALALLFAQFAGMMCEYNLVSAWAPTYFHESLGVPLGNLGRYTSLPMMLGIWFRAGVSATETALLAQGWDQLLLRKAANGVGGAIATASLLVMSVVRSPLVAMLAFTGVTLGNSFNQSSVTPNYLEVAGPDSAYFGSWTNTLAWASAYACGEAIVRLRALVGGGYAWLWLPCAAIRAASAALYLRWASVHSAREHLEGRFDTTGDGRADAFDTSGDQRPDAFDTTGDGRIDAERGG